MARDIYAPTDFNAEIAEQVCFLLAEGDLDADKPGKRLTPRQICRKAGITTGTLRVWLARYPAFLAQYRMAEQLYADHLVEEALEIADDDTQDIKIITDSKGREIARPNWDNSARARIRVETRLKIASKLFPERYGDRMQIHTTSTNLHIHETREDMQLRVRNIFEEAKKRGVDTKELMRELGLTEVNLLPEDYAPHVQDLPQRMLEEKKTITIPVSQPKRARREKVQEPVA